MKKLLATFLVLLSALQLAVALPAFAADGTSPSTADQGNPATLLGQTGLGGTPSDAANSLPVIIGGIIRIALGMLGIVFVLLILYAGFNWMTAAGDSDKVDTAKSTLTRAIIGLIIIISAYAITSFVIVRVQSAATNGGCAPGINAPGCQ